MKLTNKFAIPDTIVNVLKRPTYSKGKANLSITELIDSPRVVNLKHKHWDDIEVDASEMVWSLFGSAVHGILEHGKGDNHIVEERLHVEFDGWHISGAIDLQEVYEDGIVIKDYKVTGAWSVRNEKQAWHDQLNSYAWLVENAKQKPVKGLQIVAIIRDWSAREASNKADYPQAPIVVVDIPLWLPEKRTQFIEERLNTHAEGYFESDSGGELPDCTPDECWEKPEKFAVMKVGGVRAKSLHNTKEEAQAALPEKGYVIEHRPGERTRCASYCQVSPWCSQYQKYLESQQEK